MSFDPEHAAILLEAVLPGASLKALLPLPSESSNLVLQLVWAMPGGEGSMAVRLFRPYHTYSPKDKCIREAAVMRSLRASGVPVPRVLHSDPEGAICGAPMIATEWLEGETPPGDGMLRAREMGRTLAGIHLCPLAGLEEAILLEGESEALWFLQGDEPPTWMTSHPLGKRLWEGAKRAAEDLPEARICLVHMDFWSGQLLWREGRVAAVLDWEEASVGRPGIDLGYAMLDMALEFGLNEADALLRAYHEVLPEPIPDLPLWQAAACARPLLRPEGWIDTEPSSSRFFAFSERTLAHLEAAPERSEG